jgi:hypothetical protein
MPAGIGYGPLPVPMGLQQPDPLQDALIGVPSGLVGPEQVAMIPPPVMPEEQPMAVPVPAGLQDAPDAAPVPLWLQQQIAQQPQVQAAPANEQLPPSAQSLAGAATFPDDGFALPEGVAPDSPVGLALRASEVKRRAQQAKVDQLELAETALGSAEARTAKRQEEIAKRQEAARKRIDEQNTQIQAALRAGPGASWRGVAQAGMQALGAVLGAAFDRSGTLQKQLPQTMNAIVSEWQQRVQGDFARQIQALQVGREGAQDELDAAMDAERQLEQAGAAARVAIWEEAQRNMILAAERGQLDLAELEQQGIPQQMQAAIEAEKAAQAAKMEEDERKRITDELKLADMEAGIRYKEEQIKGERADRAKQFAELDIARQRFALDKERSGALKEQDRLDTEKKKLDILKEQGLIDDRNLAKAVPLPGGNVLVANSAEQARDFSSQVASAEVLSGLMDQIAVALETGDRDFWGGKEGQELLAKWGAAKLATKDAEQLGAIQGADEALIENLIGKDPTSISIGNLRTQAPRIREARRILEEKVNARGRSISSDFAGKEGRIELPRYEAPAEAVPTSEEARGQLLPIQSAVTGKRPRLSPSDFAAAVKTVRETAAASVGGRDRDAVVRTQAGELATALEQARAERERIARERDTATANRKRFGDSRKSEQARQWATKEAELTDEIKTVQEYEQRLAKELEKERRLLWQRVYDVGPGGEQRKRSATVSAEDERAYKRIASLIGPIGGKPAGGR